MNDEPSVLYDAPGPRAKSLNLVFSATGVVLIALLVWVVFRKFDSTGQWDSERWEPIFRGDTWTGYLLPGLEGTLKAFAMAAVLSLPFGVVFAVGRLSDNALVRMVSGAVIEFFRAIPVLILMVFIYFLYPLIGLDASAFWAVVLGLMLYNGSVLAEVIRAGVNALPRGQREAGMAIGLRPQQVLASILLPQAFRSMLPAIIAQLVVIMKDTALGYIIGYQELVRLQDVAAGFYGGITLQIAIVVALMFIAINLSLGWLATWVERRLSRGKAGGPVMHADDAAVAAIPGTQAGGGAGGGA